MAPPSRNLGPSTQTCLNIHVVRGTLLSNWGKDPSSLCVYSVPANRGTQAEIDLLH